LLRLYSKSAYEICKIRWDFIREFKIKTILDYGSGVGWFRAYRPKNMIVDNYDIANYPQTGIKHKRYDLICFWDVLEHIPNFKKLENLFQNTKHIACSVPIKPKDVKLKEWKHYKPNEHLHYFNIEFLDTFFETYGFQKVKDGYPECPPRVDIYSVVYKRWKS
jgi:hypothetical protein